MTLPTSQQGGPAARAGPDRVTDIRTRRAGATRRATRPRRTRTLGAEEEMLLLDGATGQVALVAPELLRRLGGAPWAKHELMRFQLETITGVCTSLDELRAELAEHRVAAAGVAERLGSRLVASGTAPYGSPGLACLTDGPRYLELARRFAAIVAVSGTGGYHVHVGVASRELGVQVLARLRPWLPQLLALSVNSPIADGHDTGWASRRYPLQGRWPTARPPPVCACAADYDAEVVDVIQRGEALDERGVYFLARLSPRYPTVEVRIADVCLDIGTAVLLAGLARALVDTAAEEARRGAPVAVVPDSRIAAAALAAARHGLTGPGLDPWSGAVVAQRTLVDRVLAHTRAALERSGDAEEIGALLRALHERGPGEARQRAMWSGAASPAGFARALADATITGCDD
jgi:carboxylate-amine ligase